MLILKNEIPAHKRGYWLVRDSDKARFFVSENVNEYALNRVADKVLSDRIGWGYWIDYCLGLDVHGRIAWTNLDLSEHFGI